MVGDVADFWFGVAADGEDHFGEALAGSAEEDVGLVFVVVDASEECEFFGWCACAALEVDAEVVPVGVGDAGVVARGDEVCVDLFGVGVELAELEPVVASDAGVRGASCGVFVDEVVDDAAEVFLEV